MDQSPLVDIGLPIALAIIMVGIGLSLTREDFAVQARSPRATIVGLFGQLVLVPLVGVGVALLFGLTPMLALGVVLVAATPGGATSNLITYLSRGNVALSVILTALTSVAVILTLPMWFGIGARLIPGAADEEVTVPLGQTFGLLLGVILIPVAIGMILRARRPALASRIERYVGIVGLVVLVLLIVGIVLGERDRIVDLVVTVGPAVIVLNLALIVLGGLLAWVSRLRRAEQIAIAVEFGIKNTTLTLLIAFTVIGDEEVGLAAAVYSIVMYVTAFALVYGGRRLMRTAP
ncbi:MULTISPECIES: bile acid:sodium symporter family protein [Dietzia]|uniref:Bile acid:sodium symporter n=2 Tax=Dietzia TaxID=37914 RepID=A0ABT8H3V7_9ACTN|nr:MULTISPECIES: bile acid:sodium symporter [Dietzia]MBB0993499.1 bile acid:sodium symporter family protein [Dietzia sp. SLG510A3-40A3]MBB1008426.1 bile acid:sodium symporter family protein [Dietzia sp. SLG510A3-3B2-2]MBB1017550.1 bile acid:sodium symporter family protein [Dietzia sp. DQ11-71]MVZ90752.1 bile acid:sodium symporter family protein [Microbacter sp. ANSKLAB05]ODQ84075.1 bile acid:sodium symporter [Dietzia alimentaria]